MSRNVSPAGAVRERAVPCRGCFGRRTTWAIDALCDPCFEKKEATK